MTAVACYLYQIGRNSTLNSRNGGHTDLFLNSTDGVCHLVHLEMAFEPGQYII